MVRRFRQAAEQLGLKGNVHEVVTMASLVERETAVDAERPLVASVFENRLAKKMPLMTDPSVIYGLELEGPWRGTIYESDLKRNTPYNTYLHAGCRRARWPIPAAVAARGHGAGADGLSLLCGRGRQSPGPVAVFHHARGARSQRSRLPASREEGRWPMKTMLRDLVLPRVLPLVLLAGCSFFPTTRKLPVPKPRRHANGLADDLVAQLNQRWDAMDTLTATVEIQATEFKSKEGVAKDYPSCRGYHPDAQAGDAAGCGAAYFGVDAFSTWPAMAKPSPCSSRQRTLPSRAPIRPKGNFAEPDVQPAAGISSLMP